MSSNVSVSSQIADLWPFVALQEHKIDGLEQYFCIKYQSLRKTGCPTPETT